jgi:hypothetical protein
MRGLRFEDHFSLLHAAPFLSLTEGPGILDFMGFWPVNCYQYAGYGVARQKSRPAIALRLRNEWLWQVPVRFALGRRFQSGEYYHSNTSFTI